VHRGEAAGLPVRQQRLQGGVEPEPAGVTKQPVAPHADGRPRLGVGRVAGRHDRRQAVEAAAQRQHHEHVAGVRRAGERELGGQALDGQAGERPGGAGGQRPADRGAAGHRGAVFGASAISHDPHLAEK
jgi:hypothetical protein